jgi:hypothetical protein
MGSFFYKAANGDHAFGRAIAAARTSRAAVNNPYKQKECGMKRLLLVAFLAMGTALGGTAASAAPASSGVASLGKSQSGIELVKDRRHGHWRGNRHARHHQGYRHNRHWRRDRYRGWHRYHHRPRHWQSRGCVIVGPVWVCP